MLQCVGMHLNGYCRLSSANSGCCTMNVVNVRLHLCSLHCSTVYLCSGLLVLSELTVSK